MTVKSNSFKIDTSKKFEIIDITSKINELIDIEDGIVSIFSRHSTSAIVVNENEKGLRLDLGTWQSVFFVELDGPRRARTVTLTMVGE